MATEQVSQGGCSRGWLKPLWWPREGEVVITYHFGERFCPFNGNYRKNRDITLGLDSHHNIKYIK